MEVPRTISLIGHSGSGKSTLASKLLQKCGLEGQIDFDPSEEEKQRGYSIDLGVGYCERNGNPLNIVDTPGAAEFVEEVHKGLHIAEAALLLLDSEKGVEVQTETVWDIAQNKHLPTLCFVNKMDKDEADFSGVLESLRENFDKPFLPLQWPVAEGGDFEGVVDVLQLPSASQTDSEDEVPDQLNDQIAELRQAWLEELAGQDDELMMKYLEEEEISSEDISRALRKGLKANAFIPVLCGSTETGRGLEALAEALVNLVPHLEATVDDDLRGIVFNQFRDPYLGTLSFLKLYAGALQENNSVYNLRSGEEDEIQDIYLFQGDDQTKVEEASVGDIVALGKMENLQLSDTLAASPEMESLPQPSFPKPVFSRAIRPKSESDESKMSTALQNLSSIKATIEFFRDEVTGELILSGMGDTHLGVFKNRLKSGFNVSILMEEPTVPYKRSISKTARAQYRHKKQSGGRGQFAEVYLEVKPLPRGEGFEFTDKIKGGNIPTQFIPGVEKGIREALETGYPTTDIETIVYDGDHHPVDSSEMAFKIAGREVCKKAVEQAAPIVIEPIMKCRVTTPGDYTGDIVSDLNGRRARVQGTEMADGDTIIKAEVPQAEVQNYALQLKSLTQGRASFQMEFLKYQKVPDNIAEKLMEAQE
ncbi:MAG: elongation factor G [Candidatus Bipolaricaulota bacterium]